MNKVILLILLLVIGGVFAIDYTTPIFSSNIIPLFIAVLITTAIIGIAYILSKVFDSYYLGAWVKVEIGELFMSVILVLIILGLLGVIHTVIPILTFDPAGLITAQDVIDNQIDSTKDMIYTISKNSYHLSKYSTFSYRSSSSGWFSSDFTAQAQNPGLAPLGMVLNKLLNHLSQLIIILKTEWFLLAYLEKITMFILLPLGILLRTFPTTRKMGTMLLALSIGFVIVFPISILIGNSIYESLDPSSLLDSFSIVDPGEPPEFDDVCSPAITAFAEMKEYGVWFTTCTPICMSYAGVACLPYVGMPHTYSICIQQKFMACWRPYVPFLADSGWCWPIAETIYHWQLNSHQRTYSNQLANYANLNSTGIDNVYTNVMQTAINAVVLNFIVIITILIFSIILTVGTIRSITFALGGDVSFYGLSRLI